MIQSNLGTIYILTGSNAVDKIPNTPYRNRAHYKTENAMPHEFVGIQGIIRKYQ